MEQNTKKRKNIIIIAVATAVIFLGVFAFQHLNGPKPEGDFKNVILIGWDGVNMDHLNDLLEKGKMPNFEKFINEGVFVDLSITTGATDTKAGWSEILTGYGPETTEVFDNKYYQPVPRGYTIFERLQDHFGKDDIVTVFLGAKDNNIGARGPHRLCLNCIPRDPQTYMKVPEVIMESLSAAIDYAERYQPVERKAPSNPGAEKETVIDHEQGPFLLMPSFKEMMLESRDGEPYYYTRGEVDVYLSNLGSASEVGSRAIDYLGQYRDERFFMFFHFEEPDEQGHRWGEDSIEYSDGLRLVDEWLGRIITKLENLGIRDETLIYVVTDHGFQKDGFGHAYEPDIFLATNDKTVKRSGDRKDVTPTILWRYGLNLDSISPLLEGVPLNNLDYDRKEADRGDEIRIGYFHGGRVFVPYRAYVFGEFEEAGLNVGFYTTIGEKEPQRLLFVPRNAFQVKLIHDKEPLFGRFTGRDILKYIMEGDLDGGAIGESSFVEAAAMGLPIVAVARLGHDTLETKGKAIVVRSGSGIKKPEDFIGKTVISREAGPGDATFLREFFTSIGVDPDDVNIVDYAPPSFMAEGLWSNEVDGGYYHLMMVEKVVSQGWAEIYQPFDWVNPELSQAVLVFARDYYDDHQNEIKRFLEVYMNRIKYEKENPVEKWYLQDGVAERGLQAHLNFAGMDIPRFSYPPLIDINLLNEMQDLIQKHKQIEYSAVDISPFIDQTLLKELIGELNVEYE